MRNRLVGCLTTGSLLTGALLVASPTAASPPTGPPPGQPTYTNSSPEFTLSGFRAGRLLTLETKSSLLAESGLLRRQNLKVMRSPGGDRAIVDWSLEKSGVLAAAAPRFLDLSWERVQGATGYKVLRDGEHLETLTRDETALRDLSVEPGMTYRYDIVVERSTDSGPVAPTWSMKERIPEQPSQGGSATPAYLHDQAVTQAEIESTATRSTLTWVTFIPQRRISAPSLGCDYDDRFEFDGDNHGYDWTSSDYRTVLNGVVTWSNKDFDGYKDVGVTKVFRKSTGNLVDKATASMKDMSVYKLGSDSNQVDIRMVTHAHNPFCSVGAIDGAFSFTMTQAGSYHFISGNHRQMPNHYVYIYDGGQVTDVYKRDYASTLCLIGAATCDLAYFNGYGDF